MPVTNNAFGSMLMELRDPNISQQRLTQIERIFNEFGDRELKYRSWLTIAGVAISSLVIANSDITLNQFGLFLKNQEALISFTDTQGSTESMTLYSDGGDFLVIQNAFGGRGVSVLIDSTGNSEVMQFDIAEGIATGQLQVEFFDSAAGARILMSNEVSIESQGTSSGVNAITMNESTTTPDSPTQDAQGRIYFRGNKIVFQWNDGGTVRYKYLDLTGTGVTWVHTTSAP